MASTFQCRAVTVSSIYRPSLFTAASLNSSPSSSRINRTNNSIVLRASLVQQQDAQFTQEENQLIDALIGIQGRGRSASPTKLNVSFLSNFHSLASSLLLLLFTFVM